jgi:hypothetical protein
MINKVIIFISLFTLVGCESILFMKPIDKQKMRLETKNIMDTLGIHLTALDIKLNAYAHKWGLSHQTTAKTSSIYFTMIIDNNEIVKLDLQKAELLDSGQKKVRPQQLYCHKVNEESHEVNEPIILQANSNCIVDFVFYNPEEYFSFPVFLNVGEITIQKTRKVIILDSLAFDRR